MPKTITRCGAPTSDGSRCTRRVASGRCHQHRTAASSSNVTRQANGGPVPGAVDPMLVDVPGPSDPAYLRTLKSERIVVCSLPDCDNLGFKRTRDYGGYLETVGLADRCTSCTREGRAVAVGDPGYDVLLSLPEGHTRCVAEEGCDAPTTSRSGRCRKHRSSIGPSYTDPEGVLPQRSSSAEHEILDPGEPRLIDLVGSGPQLGLAERGTDQHRKDIRSPHVDAWCVGGADDQPCDNTTKSRTGRCGAHRPPAYGSICIAVTAKGDRCRRSVWGHPVCPQHKGGPTVLDTDTELCTAIAHSGKRCTKTVAAGTVTCYLHAHWSNPDADAAGHLAGTPQANPDHDGRVRGGIGRWKTRQNPQGRHQTPPGAAKGRSGSDGKAKPPKPPTAGFRSYAHANDAVVGPEAAKRNLPNVEHLRGRKVIFVDMDGTVYDSWASIGRKDNSLVGTPENRHIRHDTIEAIKAQIEANTGPDGIPPVPVALTWRAGCEKVTREWLGYVADDTGLDIQDVFLPGSTQDIAGLTMPRSKGGGVDHQANRTSFKGGQVAYKHHLIKALLDVLDVEPVAHFEDNADVLKMSADLGTPHIHHVQRLVEIQPHEWSAGYLGAPKPKWSSGGSWNGKSECEVCSNPFDGVNVRKSDKDSLRCTDCVASVGTWAEEQKAKRSARRAAAANAKVGKARKIAPPTDPFTPVPADDYSAGNHCIDCGTPVGGHPDPWAICDDCDHATVTDDGTLIEEGADLWLDTGGTLEEVTVMMADDGTDSVAVKRRSDGEMLFVDAESLHTAPF